MYVCTIINFTCVNILFTKYRVSVGTYLSSIEFFQLSMSISDKCVLKIFIIELIICNFLNLITPNLF